MGVTYTFKDVPKENYFLSTLLPIILLGIMMFFFLSSMMMRVNGANQDPMMRDFTKNKAQRYDPDKNDIRFEFSNPEALDAYTMEELQIRAAEMMD